MSYINTNPARSDQEIRELIEEVRQKNTRTIDGEVLANLLDLCRICGLKKKELMNLKIGDVKLRGRIRDQFRLDRKVNPRLRGADAEPLIDRHYSYLEGRYSRLPNSPLFPTKMSKDFYKDDELQKQLEPIYRSLWGRKCLSSIRQSAICRHYDELKDQGLSPEECLKKTVEFAGHKSGSDKYPDYRHTEDVLRRRQPVSHLANFDDDELPGFMGNEFPEKEDW